MSDVDPTMNCLSVIVPCYNEAPTIREILTRVLESAYVSEVIVVDDGSTDETSISQKLSAQIGEFR